MGKNKRKKGKQKGANDEDSNVNADGIPAASREIVQRMHEIVSFSELEIYGVLVECDMMENRAINRLLDIEQHPVEINQGQNNESGNSSGHNVNSEASTEQGISNQLAALSTTSSILVPRNSELANLETRNVSVSSGEAVPSLSAPSSSDITTKSSDEAVPSLSVPSSSDLTNVGIKRVPINPVKTVRPTMMISSAFGPRRPPYAYADVLKMGLLLPSKWSVTEATVKDDSPLHEKPLATNPSSQTDAQLGESASVSNQNMRDEPASEAMQNSFACPGDIVLQYPYTRDKNSQCLNSFLDRSRSTSQSIPTLSSSMTERQVPSGQYGNVINSPYSLPNQNNMRPSTFQKCVGRNNNTLAHVMNSPNSRPEHNNISASSAFHQHDGSNNNTYFYHQSLESMYPQYRNSNLLKSDTSIGPSAQHQSGEFYYSLWGSPNFRPSQQEQQQSYTRIGDERSSATSQNQQNSTSDPSHQTQQGNNGYGEEDKH